MSRIGKKPISLPDGIDVEISSDAIKVKKGSESLDIEIGNKVSIEKKDKELIVSQQGDTKQSRAFWGTYRALINNAVIGLSEGFSKTLEINGVGYKVALKGNVLEFALGYSHLVNYNLPKGVKAVVSGNTITISGTNKQVIGQSAADIRGFRKPEPYKGKGIKYSDEIIVKKAGKTAKK